MRGDKKCLQYFIWFAFIVIYFLWDCGICYKLVREKLDFLMAYMECYEMIWCGSAGKHSREEIYSFSY